MLSVVKKHRVGESGRGATLVLLVSLSASAGFAQFSPGPLSRAHKGLSGPAACAACHAVAGGRSFKCLECHEDIRKRLAAHRGLHAVLMSRGPEQAQCAACHSEHNGEDFALIRWEGKPEQFDHSKTGYVLEGAHQGLQCSRCHNPKNVDKEERFLIAIKDLRRSYLGLKRDCAGCHQDVHRGQLAANCRQCHSMTGWKPASGFSHAAAKFQLLGAHEKVACGKCHASVPGAQHYMKFIGLQFAACTPCHTDPHRGAFPGRCESCHSTGGWKGVRLASEFDHSRTSYPLTGKHAGVSCDKCHRGPDFKQPVAHARCIDCHDPSSHRGQFLARSDGGDCGSCHRVEGWRPARFGIQEHQQTRYALQGRHANVECAKCHAPKGLDTVYRVRFDQCAACHADPHRAEFAAEPHKNRCEECHTLRGFRPSTFALARHADARFRLEGAHAAVSCADCHVSKENRAGRFRFDAITCGGCHGDPHTGQFRVQMASFDSSGGAACLACHTLARWQDVTKFDHAATRFALSGAHKAVPCEKCHAPRSTSPGIQSVVFRSAPSTCSSCHQDVHAGQFAAAAGKTDCARCHLTGDWKGPSLFDHERGTNFALSGAHRAVSCAQCHTSKRQLDNRLVVIYKLAPRECSGCHGPQIIASKTS